MTVTTVSTDNAIIQNALDILSARIQQPETYITSPDDTKSLPETESIGETA